MNICKCKKCLVNLSLKLNAMREILFRGKRVDNKQFVYGYFVGEFIYNPNVKEGTTCWFKVIPETVGQFTGLTDKNGVKIFEGDIVKFHKGYVDDSWTDTEQGMPYEIKFISEYGYLGFMAIRKNRRLIPIPDLNSKYPFKWKVIGNVHDNTELLK